MLTTAENWQIISRRVFFRYYPLSFAFNLALALGFLSFVYLKQASFKGEHLDICLCDSEIPDWFSHRGDGSSISFYVPDSEIQGLIVWIVCGASERRLSLPYASATIRNKSKDVRLFHWSTFIPLYYSKPEYHSWVNYVTFSRLPCAMEGGTVCQNNQWRCRRQVCRPSDIKRVRLVDSQGILIPCTSPVENLDKVCEKMFLNWWIRTQQGFRAQWNTGDKPAEEVSIDLQELVLCLILYILSTKDWSFSIKLLLAVDFTSFFLLRC